MGKLSNVKKLVLSLGIILACFCLALILLRSPKADAASKKNTVSLDKSSVTLAVGKKTSLKLINKPARAAVKWSSSKKTVAAVSQKGTVSAKKSGKTDITCKVTYTQNKKKTTVNLKCKVTVKAAAASQNSLSKATVYMTSNISASGLVKVYDALGWTPQGNVAVKLSTGEPPASNYLDPKLIKNLVQKVDGTIVECNTAYGGSRSSTAMHMQVAEDHGFTAIADVDIMDADGSISLTVKGGSRLKENFVGSHFKNYDSFIILSHFKGHSMAGFGGAIKNISIGIASSEGKSWIHSGGKSKTNPWGGAQNAFLEAMGDAGKAVSDSLNNGKNIVYINVMNNLSIDCDCDGNPAKPEIHDIGILASTDPVALDQACIDLIYAQKNGDAASLVSRIESKNGLLTLKHAEEIGLGTRSYNLVTIK